MKPLCFNVLTELMLCFNVVQASKRSFTNLVEYSNTFSFNQYISNKGSWYATVAISEAFTPVYCYNICLSCLLHNTILIAQIRTNAHPPVFSTSHKNSSLSKCTDLKLVRMLEIFLINRHMSLSSLTILKICYLSSTGQYFHLSAQLCIRSVQ